MVVRGRISTNEKCEVLSAFSTNFILMISGFLGGLTAALLLSVLAVFLVQEVDGGEIGGIAIGFLVIFSLLGMVAAKLLQKEYKINREAYKRVAEFYIPLVYPFFFLCFLGFGIILWFKAVNIDAWIVVLILTLGLIILGSTWRFWHTFWLSILSPIDWRTVIEARNFNRQLKMSFAEVKRYPSPLSLTIMDVGRSDQLKDRVGKKIQEKLINIIDRNSRETDAVGRIENGRVVVAMTHTGSSGASVQAKRVQNIFKEYLKSLGASGERITLSIGIASYAPDMASYKDLIEKAQVALLQAKEEGGGISIEGKDPCDIKVTTENTEEKT